MFYSQFILAKKGPLGTIWIAAHLERKLRKNQVADTDIGVSVDSILCPDVPIALRLSSHLLLGVVRIYSRKVNYLFDDCSEALLKVKQAFRSTAVDLPPEESTAPYHSITLPETFDLDDFELPDAENLQGNYDHHVSSRDQITLQDNMDGLNFSTTQFGLDERFGDEDTSGFDLDEELFLSKVTAPEQAEVVEASNPETHQSTQPLTPFDVGKDDEDGHGDTEAMDAGGCDDPMDYSHAPSTPGLVEEPNFSKVQGAVCDDHLDLGDDPKFVNVPVVAAGNDHMHIEDLNMCAAQDDTETIGPNSDLHHVMPNAVTSPLPTDTNSISVFGEPELQLKPEENRTSNAEQDGVSSNAPTTHSVDGANADREETLENLLDNNVERPSYSRDAPVPEDPSANTDREETLDFFLGNNVSRPSSSHDAPVPEDPSANTDREKTLEFFLGNNVSRPSSSHDAPVPEDPSANTFSVTETVSEKSYFQPASGLVDLYQDVRRPEASNNVEDSREEELLRPHGALASDIEVSGGIYPENPKMQACQEPDDSRDLNVVFGNMHILRRCNYQDQPSSINNGRNDSGSVDLPCESNVPFLADTSVIREVSDAPEASTVIQGEGCYATNVVAPVSEEFQRAEPALHEDIRVGSLFPREFLSENKEASVTSELPAVEKLLSVPEMHAGPQNNMLQFIPANTQFGTAYEGDAGRKRSFVDQHADPQNNMMQFTPVNTQFGTAYEGDAGRQRSFVDQHADPQNNMMQFTPANIQLGTAYGGDAGRKRSFAESSMTVQGVYTIDSFEAVRSKRAKGSVPDDNDLLSSILVGRRSSVFKVKETPPVKERVRMKRPRSTPRPLKRKVLMDDTMVLHGDVIRQQLTNTEAIRRTRKKAPCTRSEIWMLQKALLEDEIFTEPILTGLSAKLAALHTQTYDLSKIRLSLNATRSSVANAAQEDENDPQKATNAVDLSAEPSIDKEIATDGFIESNVAVNDVIAECPNNLESLNHMLESVDNGMATTVLAEPQSLSHEQSTLVAEIHSEDPASEPNPPTGPVVELTLATDPAFGDNPELVANSINPQAPFSQETAFGDNPDLAANSIKPQAPLNQETTFGDNPDLAANSIKPQAPFNLETAFGDNPDLVAKSINPQAPFNEETAFGDNPDLAANSINPQAPFNQETNIDSSFHIEELDQPSDQKLEVLPVETEIAGDNGSSERKDSDTLRMPEENGEFSGAVGAEETPPKEMENGAPFDFGENVTDAQPSGPVLAESDRPADHLDMTLDQSMQDLFKDELPTNEAEVPTAHGSTEEPNFAVVHPQELGGHEENATMNGDEFPSALEAGPQGTVDTDVLASDHEDIEDHTELGYELDGHDTGFLNDDDDDIAEEDDSYAHSPDQTEVDYSGWSSRTRAVAKYLNVLFDKEPDHGKKILPMDNLLVGKTRKEASRMFFEALVLKTRDYVHVEQENPFDKINIKPGVKMAKFNF